jgi:hypothetical protein
MVTAYVPAASAEIHIAHINSKLRHWLAGEVKQDVERFAPVDTGYMKTHVRIEADAAIVHVLGAGIPPNREAPVYVEYGTRPHDIPNAFGWGFTAHHPGTRPQPFMRPAAYRRRAIPPWVVQLKGSTT